MADALYADEVWRTIRFAPDYEVSSLSRIRRVALRPPQYHGRLLKPRTGRDGRLSVRLYADGGSTWPTVHRIVCITFHGDQPSELHEVAHNDGNPLNNLPSNLRWATRAENYADRNIHGTHNKGARNGAAKLAPPDVERIIELSRTLPSRKVAAIMGICKSQVGNILRGDAWA